MIAKRTGFFLMVLGLAATPALAVSQQWLHIRVEKAGKASESVRINVPLSLAETVLPLIEDKGPRRSKIFAPKGDFDKQALRTLWEALKTQDPVEFVTVESPKGEVRVSLENDYLIVKSEEGSDKTVDVRIPAPVVDALLSGDDEALNLLEAIRALQHSGVRDIISIRDGESSVQVWIDEFSRSRE